MQICPSMPEIKAEDYAGNVKRLSPYYKYFQIDFADGIYVENITASLEDFLSAMKKQFDMKGIKRFSFDFHFMVRDYEKEIRKLEMMKNEINVNKIFIHFDLNPDLKKLTSDFGFPIGLVLNPEDKVMDLAKKYDLNKMPFIQLMSVIPGAQGRPFIPDVLNKIEQLRELDYRKNIFLDGAVNDKTMPDIIKQKFRPDVVCPGSYLTKSPADELKERVDFLNSYS